MEKSNFQRYSEGLKNPRNLLALGMSALASFGIGAVYGGLEKQSGGYEVLGTNEAKTYVVDDKLVVGSWNMHDQPLENLSETRDLIEKHDIDVMLMQEVNRRDAEELSRRFKGFNTGYLQAERVLKEPQDGGFGNLIMTRAEQERPKSWSIPAESVPQKMFYAGKGLIEDMFNGEALAAPRTKEGLQEKRAMGLVTIASRPEEQRQEKSIVGTTHISGQDRIDERQLDNVMNIAEDNAKDSVPIVVCGDLNNPPSIVEQKSRESGFEVLRDGYTTVDSKITTDYCFFKTAGKMTPHSFVVDRHFATDHHPIVATFYFPHNYQVRQMNPYNLRP